MMYSIKNINQLNEKFIIASGHFEIVDTQAKQKL